MADSRYLVAGLGNPGPEYHLTRHNIGFLFLDHLAEVHGWQIDAAKMQGLYCQGRAHGCQVFYVKPQTFMNRSGQAVGALARFFKIPSENILVVHDELDLEPGQVKLKKGGGHAGHNGLRDIHAQLGTPDYWRLRLGIGHPGVKSEVVNWVLKKPSMDHRIAIEQAIDHSLRALPDLLAGDMVKATKDIHTAP